MREQQERTEDGSHCSTCNNALGPIVYMITLHQHQYTNFCLRGSGNMADVPGHTVDAGWRIIH